MKRLQGVLGLSGNPPHLGHVALSRIAREQANLHSVTWMINPHSPFKDPKLYAPVEDRLWLANIVARQAGELGKTITVSDFEVVLRYMGAHNATVTMLRYYSEAYPSVQPVWIMGSDNLAQIHQWGSWTEVMERYPVLVGIRSDSEVEIENTVAAKKYAANRISINDFTGKPGTWSVFGVGHSSTSSTVIREQISSGLTPTQIPEEAVTYIRERGLYGTSLNQTRGEWV